MKVPKRIEKAILGCAKHNAIAREYNNEIRDWLKQMGEDENDVILDPLIDSTEIGYDPKFFINFLKECELNK